MDNFKIANMYNDEGLTLKEIGEKLGISKSTVQRRLTANGWHFDKIKGKYIYTIDNNENEKIENQLLENSKIVAFDLKDGTNNFKEHGLIEKNSDVGAATVNRTYAISEKIDRAIKIKAAIENKKPIDIVREALETYIEDKYMHM